MATKNVSKASSKTPWWLTQGEEYCVHCGGLYFYELEVRCTDCDGPTCPHCHVTHAEGYLICPDCFSHSAEGVTHG